MPRSSATALDWSRPWPDSTGAVTRFPWRTGGGRHWIAVDLLHAYQADPLAKVDRIILDHPDFAMAHVRAGALATATDRAFEPELLKSVAAARWRCEPMTASKRTYPQPAHGSTATGNGQRRQWGQASIAWPRDLLALQFAHLGDFYLGHSHMLRDRVARVLPPLESRRAGLRLHQGMYAFGLEEAGDYEQAESHGRGPLL